MIPGGGELKKIQARIERLQAANLSFLEKIKEMPTPEEFAFSVLGFHLDPWQQEYMTNAPLCSRIGIAASRQSGKSTVTAIFTAWCLVFISGFRCLVASRSLRQAGYFLQKVKQAILTIIPPKAMLSLNRLSIELPNGSFIVSIPCAQPDAGRGFDPHLMIVDEAAFAPPGLFTAITPSVAATHGAIHMISSPNGRHGFFFDAFEGDGRHDFWTRRVTWEECPRITAEQMEIEKRVMGKVLWRQEFNAEFIVPEGAFFGASALEAIQDSEDYDLTDLELADMEAILNTHMPLPDPTREDLRAALDGAERVKQLLYG